jgi:DNA-binding transcriptional MerR regulator
MKKNKLLKISEIARITGLPATTIRYYTNIGLLKVSQYSAGGFRLFDLQETLENIEKIKEIVGHRTPLNEVRKKIRDDNE